MRKIEQTLVLHLGSLDFSVFGYYRWSDGKECVILLELDRWMLPAVRKAIGPKIRFAADLDAFVKKHSGALNLHLEKDHIVAVEKRVVVDAAPALLRACRHPHGLGMPAHMEKAVAKARLLQGAAIAKAAYAEFLSDYLFSKIQQT